MLIFFFLVAESSFFNNFSVMHWLNAILIDLLSNLVLIYNFLLLIRKLSFSVQGQASQIGG